MSQDFHQNIFSFSNGFERSEQQQHVVEQIRRDKLRTQSIGAPAPPALVGMEEDGIPSYESSAIYPEMFNFSSGTAAEMLESHTYRDPRAAAAADWFLHRQDAAEDGGLGNSKNGDDAASYNNHQMSSINADSAAAMQLFLMNPQQQRSPSPSPPSSSSLHMLLPNPSSSFHSPAGGAFGQFTWPSNAANPNGIVEGQGLSLSLSSSKAEELRLGLLFDQGGVTTPSQYGGGALHLQGGVSQNRQLHVGLGTSYFGGANILSSSKYAKAAQELLEEFCSVGRGHLKKNKVSKHNNDNKNTAGGAATGGGDSSKDNVPPLSASERLEHQRRKVKLSTMLDEVDRRYSHYCERMQMVVNSFDMIMGFGAAAPYTSLAQKAMSRHFRCLREAVSEQLKHSCEQLGEKEGSKSGLTKGETPRLKFLELRLRQQRAFQQMGMTMEQEAWRPQRGLPQRSLTILRAWLFEHFLHPYPSDADKHLLARQTGLSRNQVANWFINARVRLWKPMVEEMYLQEAKDNSENPNRDQTSTAAAATTTAPAAVTPAKINVHENDPSLASFNASENHPDNNDQAVSLQTAAAGVESPMIRLGATSGDVSLTLGLRHAGNLPDNTSFSVRDHFGSF